MKHDDHFEIAVDRAAAKRLVDFEPRRPAFTAGFDLVSLYVYVMGHRKRRLPIGGRGLIAHYGAFVIGQPCAGEHLGAAPGSGYNTIEGFEITSRIKEPAYHRRIGYAF